VVADANMQKGQKQVFRHLTEALWASLRSVGLMLWRGRERLPFLKQAEGSDLLLQSGILFPELRLEASQARLQRGEIVRRLGNP